MVQYFMMLEREFEFVMSDFDINLLKPNDL
jgi:hypothetical protein